MGSPPDLFCIICGRRQDEVKVLHNLPKERKKLEKWEQALGVNLQPISRQWRICSFHFTPDCYRHSLSQMLNSNAVPFPYRPEQALSATEYPEPPIDDNSQDTLPATISDTEPPLARVHLQEEEMDETNCIMTSVLIMKNEPDICSVCLSCAPNQLKVTDFDYSNRSCLYKLQFCISDIEWHESFTICQSCASDLDLVYHFREKCLNADSYRKSQESENIKIEPEIIEAIKIESPVYENFESETPTEDPLEIKFSCEECDLFFESETEAVDHSVKTHTTDPTSDISLQGSDCDNIYAEDCKTPTDLKIHEGVQLTKKERQCSRDKCFNTQRSLRSRKCMLSIDPKPCMLSIDPKPRLYKCCICLKRFSMKWSYNAHMKLHKNETPFICDICDKKFNDRVVWQKHLLLHSNKSGFSSEVRRSKHKKKDVKDTNMKTQGIGKLKVSVISVSPKTKT